MKRKLTIIVECGDDSISARVNHKNFLFIAVDTKISGIRSRIQGCLMDYIKHEGQKNSWKNVKLRNITFEIKYDLYSLFLDSSHISRSKIAEMSKIDIRKINRFAKQKEFATRVEAEKIYKALVKIGYELMSYKDRLYVPKRKLRNG